MHLKYLNRELNDKLIHTELIDIITVLMSAFSLLAQEQIFNDWIFFLLPIRYRLVSKQTNIFPYSFKQTAQCTNVFFFYFVEDIITVVWIVAFPFPISIQISKTREEYMFSLLPLCLSTALTLYRFCIGQHVAIVADHQPTVLPTGNKPLFRSAMNVLTIWVMIFFLNLIWS